MDKWIFWCSWEAEKTERMVIASGDLPGASISWVKTSATSCTVRDNKQSYSTSIHQIELIERWPRWSKKKPTACYPKCWKHNSQVWWGLCGFAPTQNSNLHQSNHQQSHSRSPLQGLVQGLSQKQLGGADRVIPKSPPQICAKNHPWISPVRRDVHHQMTGQGIQILQLLIIYIHLLSIPIPLKPHVSTASKSLHDAVVGQSICHQPHASHFLLQRAVTAMKFFGQNESNCGISRVSSWCNRVL